MRKLPYAYRVSETNISDWLSVVTDKSYYFNSFSEIIESYLKNGNPDQIRIIMVYNQPNLKDIEGIEIFNKAQGFYFHNNDIRSISDNLIQYFLVNLYNAKSKIGEVFHFMIKLNGNSNLDLGHFAKRMITTKLLPEHYSKLNERYDTSRLRKAIKQAEKEWSRLEKSQSIRKSYRNNYAKFLNERTKDIKKGIKDQILRDHRNNDSWAIFFIDFDPSKYGVSGFYETEDHENIFYKKIPRPKSEIYIDILFQRNSDLDLTFLIKKKKWWQI